MPRGERSPRGHVASDIAGYHSDMRFRDMTVRVRRLDDRAPDDGLAADLDAAGRLALVWTLSREAWLLSDRPLPSYARHEAPIVVRSLRRARTP